MYGASPGVALAEVARLFPRRSGASFSSHQKLASFLCWLSLPLLGSGLVTNPAKDTLPEALRNRINPEYNF